MPPRSKALSQKCVWIIRSIKPSMTIYILHVYNSPKIPGCISSLNCTKLAFPVDPYHRLWLLSICTYNARLQRTMRLTKRRAYTGVPPHPSLTICPIHGPTLRQEIKNKTRLELARRPATVRKIVFWPGRVWYVVTTYTRAPGLHDYENPFRSRKKQGILMTDKQLLYCRTKQLWIMGQESSPKCSGSF